MPEATNIAASSTETFPGYSVLDGQYELHETGNFYFLEKLRSFFGKILDKVKLFLRRPQNFAVIFQLF